MMGSVMDAEDAVQEAYLRWERASEDDVRSPSAYLSKAVTRLCIDRLRSGRVRREQYVGPWLPEPLLGEQAKEISLAPDLEDTLSMAFLVLLESLTPVERAVFLLREVFDYEYAEIASLVGKSEANCRQISRRARQSVAATRPRFESSPQQEERLIESFLQASLSGDMEALLALLSDDVTLYSDGGGRTRAALNPIYGAGDRGPRQGARRRRLCPRQKAARQQVSCPTRPPCPASPSPQGQQDNARRAITRGSPIPERRMILPRRHPDRPVEPDDLAVEHLVIDDVFDEIGVLLGPAEPWGERDLFAQRVAGVFGQAGHHRGVEDAGGDCHDADAALRKFAGDGEGQSDDPALGRGVGYLPDLAVESGHAGCVDDDAALSAL
jgi:RNA polymerase sigma factor (sigma-70 family)